MDQERIEKQFSFIREIDRLRRAQEERLRA